MSISARYRATSGPRQLREGSLAYEILRYAAAGTLIVGIVGILAVAPGLAYAGKFFMARNAPKAERRRHRSRLRESLRRLEGRRLVRLIQKEDGTVAVEITDLGKKVLFRSSKRGLHPKRQRRWDGRWRIVLFDIPETKREARDAVRRFLRDIGFFSLQKSAFATPYPCQKEIAALGGFFEVADCLIYLEAANLGRHERVARRHFGLKSK